MGGGEPIQKDLLSPYGLVGTKSNWKRASSQGTWRTPFETMLAGLRTQIRPQWLLRRMLLSVEGRHFTFMHCWEIMKDEPKWQDIRPKGARPSALEACGAQIPEASNTLDLDSDEPSPAAAKGKRPIGRDAAKASRKKQCSSSSKSSSEYASKFEDLSLRKISIWQEENSKKGDRFDHLATIEEKRFDELRQHNESMLQLEQVKIQIMRDKLAMQMQEKEKETHERERLEDERILKIDLDSCTPELRLYYQALRDDILEKVAARCTSNQRQ